MVWLWCIAASLVAQWGFLDIAVRDLEISLAAFAQARLSEVREVAVEPMTHDRELRITRPTAA